MSLTPNPGSRHFDMSPDYTQHSNSQQSIGHRLIATTVSEVEKRFHDREALLRICDLACGPGGLTVELLAALKAAGNSAIDIAGLDLTAANVRQAEANSSGRIQGIQGSFYNFPEAVGKRDLIFSNEGLHWQPPRDMDAIIYTHLSDQEFRAYETWALDNLTHALSNIYQSLSDQGVTILQFGHRGQLANLWALVDKILDEDEFAPHKGEVSFPLFYPTLEQIHECLVRAGFDGSSVQVQALEENLVENSAFEVTKFFQAFTESQFKRIFGEASADRFYSRVKTELEAMDEGAFSSFKEGQWQRTIIIAQKASGSGK